MGINYSTVLSMLGSRIYLREVQMNGEWFPGNHEGCLSGAIREAQHEVEDAHAQGAL